VLLYQLDDRRTQLFFMGGRYPRLEEISAIYESMERLKADESPVGLALIREGATGVAESKARVIISAMKEMELVREARGARFKLVKAGLSRDGLEAISRQYAEKAEKDRKKLEQMMIYAQAGACRWKALLDYFGEEEGSDSCGHCDNCVRPLEEQIAPPVSKDKQAGLVLV
jgi:ATP-dependent DNA helicase RecQ